MHIHMMNHDEHSYELHRFTRVQSLPFGQDLKCNCQKIKKIKNRWKNRWKNKNETKMRYSFVSVPFFTCWLTVPPRRYRYLRGLNERSIIVFMRIFVIQLRCHLRR